LFAAGFLCGCSTPSPASLAENDPWEKTNRDVFAFDVWVEHNIARPVDDGYRAVVPEPARDGIHNLVTNLHSPIVLANDVLQGDGDKAADTFGRLVLNSTIGIGGLIDVAGKIGIPGHENDFGVTLGRNGVGEGSYLVLPFVGPLPPRDLVGSGVDGFFDPLSYARFSGKDTWMLVRGALRVLDVVDRQRDQFDSIERTSIDFYATTRNLYRQSRNAKIKGKTATDTASLPDF
jgi:phospholipid-binding lipoprotein MlaA